MTIRTLDSEIKELEIILDSLRHMSDCGVGFFGAYDNPTAYDPEGSHLKHNILRDTLIPRYEHALEVARRSRNRIDYMRAMAHGEITQHIHHDHPHDNA